jgi:hypothetical protein
MIPSSLNSYNFDAGLDYGKTTGSKHQKSAQLSRQKISASPRQIYNAQAACPWPQPLSQETRHHPSYMLKASEESSIVCTIAADTVCSIIQVHTRLNCLDKRTRFQAGSIVAAIPLRLVATKKSSLSRFMTAALYTWRRKMILD